ncbi:MAG: PLDc N-terminal domain-containing protein [Verrucomicrobiota bacterium]
MMQFLERFSMDSLKFNYQVLMAMIVIWGAVVLCATSSIRSQPFTPRQRTFWLSLVVFVPVLGVLAYLPFSFRPENYHDLAIWKKAKLSDE